MIFDIFHDCLLDLSNRCSYNNHTLKCEEGESVQPQYFVIDQNNAESKVMPIPSQKILAYYEFCVKYRHYKLH